MHDHDTVVTSVDDAIARDGQVLVLVGAEVMLLSPVSSEIAVVAAGGIRVRDLSDHLLEKFGPPPTGNTADDQTRVLVTRMRDAGVVRVVRHGPSATE